MGWSCFYGVGFRDLRSSLINVKKTSVIELIILLRLSIEITKGFHNPQENQRVGIILYRGYTNQKITWIIPYFVWRRLLESTGTKIRVFLPQTYLQNTASKVGEKFCIKNGVVRCFSQSCYPQSYCSSSHTVRRN